MPNLRHAWVPIVLLLANCTGGGGQSESSEPPVEKTPAQLDSDGDGLNDAQEAELGLNPDSADSDADGLTDPDEIDRGTDPLSDDTDGDGLLDGAEIDAGADPLLTDTDNDRLDDKQEVDLGTDPTDKDTDGDHYTDYEEFDFGSDALDKQSVIYQGGWPYNPDKEELVDPGLSGSVAFEAMFPNLTGVDQFGDTVQLYDLLGHGQRPVLVDFSAQWCGPCNNLADYMTGVENGFEYPLTREAVENGDVYWFTALMENNFGLPADEAVCNAWYTLHPDENIPVVGPPEHDEILTFLGLIYFPTTIWLNSDGTTNAFNLGVNPYLALQALESSLAEQ